MFIKILRGDTEATYECARFTKRPAPSPPGSGLDIDNVELSLEGTPEQTMVMLYHAKDTDVFVLNSEGKTIDAFRFSRQRSGPPLSGHE